MGLGGVLGEMFVKLGFKNETYPIKGLIQDMSNLDVRTVAALFGMDKLYMKLKDISIQSVETALSLYQFGQETRMSVTGAQQMSNMVEALGGNAKGAMQGMAALKQEIFELSRGGGHPMAWGMMGAEPNRNPLKTMESMRAAWQRLTTEEEKYYFTQYAHMVGVNEDLMYAVRSNDQEFAQWRQRLYMSNEYIGQLRDQNKAWIDLKQSMDNFGQSIAGNMAPQLAQVFKDFKVFVDMLREAEKKSGAVSAGSNFVLWQASTMMEGLAHPVRSVKETGGMAQNAFNVIVHATAEKARDIAYETQKAIRQLLHETEYQSGVKQT